MLGVVKVPTSTRKKCSRHENVEVDGWIHGLRGISLGTDLGEDGKSHL